MTSDSCHRFLRSVEVSCDLNTKNPEVRSWKMTLNMVYVDEDNAEPHYSDDVNLEQPIQCRISGVFDQVEMEFCADRVPLARGSITLILLIILTKILDTKLLDYICNW